MVFLVSSHGPPLARNFDQLLLQGTAHLLGKFFALARLGAILVCLDVTTVAPVCTPVCTLPDETQLAKSRSGESAPNLPSVTGAGGREMGPLCIRGDGLDREYGNPNYSGCPGGLALT